MQQQQQQQQQQQATQLILQSPLSPPSLSTTLETEKKKNASLPLAIVAYLRSRHILWQYFDSYLLEVRKKRKVKGCRGEGGGLKKRSCQKGIPESLSNGGGLRLFIPPRTLFRGHTRPGASVQLALPLPGSSWTPLGISSPSSAALWRSAAVSGVEGGPGSGGGGSGDGKVSYRKWTRLWPVSSSLKNIVLLA